MLHDAKYIAAAKQLIGHSEARFYEVDEVLRTDAVCALDTDCVAHLVKVRDYAGNPHQVVVDIDTPTRGMVIKGKVAAGELVERSQMSVLAQWSSCEERPLGLSHRATASCRTLHS